MGQGLIIHGAERHGNLHISLSGIFDSEAAVRISTFILRKHNGEGNIFIKTGNLSKVTARSRGWFTALTNILNLPAKKIYLMGDKAMEVCPDQGRVLISKQQKKEEHKGCGGKCKNCKCKERKEARNQRVTREN